jgi:hypothetical protein
MPKFRWRSTVSGRFVKAPRFLSWLVRLLTVKERVD